MHDENWNVCFIEGWPEIVSEGTFFGSPAL